MVEIKQHMISEIPVLELYEKGAEYSKLPVVIFYHGWESRKERVLEQGFILAKNGFRAILPEAMHHGERQKQDDKELNPMTFWNTVLANIQEFPLIVDYYEKQQLLKKEEVNVAGLSFGGITTSALLTQYDWIHTAAILMGSPSPKEFSLWTLKQFEKNGLPVSDLMDKESLLLKLDELEPISLDKHPEKIANRPIYIWHGKVDPTVPFHITNDFVEQIKNEPYSENVVFEVSKNVGHEVPQEVTIAMTSFFKEQL